MIISARITDKDLEKYLQIMDGLKTGWEEILSVPTEISHSEVVKLCIRRTYYELYEKDKKS